MEEPKPKDETVKKQRRASRPKVKTGCNNCKNRRVKCDETRPQCMLCDATGDVPANSRRSEVCTFRTTVRGVSGI